MLIGNIQAQESVKKYFDVIQREKQVAFPFLLLAGPSYVGKTSCVEENVKNLLGDYISTDFLPLYDLAEHVGKKHTLKVEVPTKEQHIEVDGTYLPNLGTRDVVQWMSLAPVGEYKVVFVENIERMTISAANAFLKTLEEPLPGRIIVATTANKESLLDTILSRACIMQFHIPPTQEVRAYLEQRYAEKTHAEREFALSYALGRIGYAKRLLEQEDISEQSQLFDTLLKSLQAEHDAVVNKYTAIKSLSARGGAQTLIDAVLFASSGQTDRLKARNMLASNVSEDNILFNLSL